MFVILLLCSVVLYADDSAQDKMLAEMMKVDGIIKVKYSNFTGYDLWFPNGTQRWTENLSASYVCDDWWYDSPIQTELQSFNPKGCALVCCLSAIISLLSTAGFPMLMVISKQARLITKQQDKIAKNNEETSRVIDKCSCAEVREMRQREILDHPGSDRKLCDSLRRQAKIWRIVGIVWMAFSVLAMFCACVVVLNFVMSTLGLPSLNTKAKFGYCYYLDRSNMSYSTAVEDAVRILAEETNTPAGEIAASQAMVMIESNNGRTFYGECGNKFYQPSEGMGILWTITPEYEEICEPIDMLEFEGYHVESLYGCNPGNKCNAGQADKWHDDFPYHLLSGCSKHNGNAETDFVDEKKGMYGATSIEQFGKCMLNSRFRITKHEFKINSVAGWKKCHWDKKVDGKRMYRTEDGKTVDVTDKVLKDIEISNNKLLIYPFGWLQHGEERIILDQTLLATQGEDLKLYWGSNNATKWMVDHFDVGNIQGSYRDPAATLPSFRPIDTRPPFVKECTMRIITHTDAIKEFVEFKEYCPSVNASITDDGNVIISTPSTERCVVNIKAKINGKIQNTSKTIDSRNSFMFYGSEPFQWGCVTNNDYPETATSCGYDTTSWHNFRPKFLDTKYEVTNSKNYIAEVGEPQGPSSPSKWARVWDIIKDILIGIAVVVAVMLVLVVVLKVTSSLECCQTRCPGIAVCGRNLCTKNKITQAQLQMELQSKQLLTQPNQNSTQQRRGGHRARRRSDSEDEDYSRA